MQDTVDSFIKRMFGFSLGPIFSALIGFITTPITTYFILPEEFGKASMYSTGLGLITLFVYLGLDQSFVREYNSETNKRKLLWNCFTIPFVFSIIIALLCYFFEKPISILLFNEHESFIMLILVLSLPATVFYRFNTLIIRMQEKAKLFSLLSITGRIVYLPLLLILLFFFEKSFKSIVLAQFLSLLIPLIFAFVINIKFWKPDLEFDKNLLLKIFKFGLPLIPVTILYWVLNSMDKIALRTWSNYSELGLYSTAFKFVLVLNILNQSFSSFWIPTSFKWYEEKTPNSRFINVSHKLLVIYMIIFGLIVFFKDAIILLFDKEYAEASMMIPFLLLFPIMSSVSSTTDCGIGFKRKNTYTIFATGTVALLNFVGNYFLVPVIGGLGASISTGVSFIAFFWIKTFISRKLWFNFDLKFYAINIALLLLFSTVSVVFNNYIILVIIFILIMIYNINEIKSIICIMKNFFKFNKKKV